MYPPSSDSSGPMMFGGSSAPGGNPQPGPNDPQRLITDLAPVTDALQRLASSHPELQATIEQMLMTLKQGIVEANQQMQSPPSGGGGVPAY